MATSRTRPRRPVPTLFGRNLDAAIDAADMTNHQVAVLSGMTSTEVSYYRNANRVPSVYKAHALACAVGKTIEELLADAT